MGSPAGEGDALLHGDGVGFARHDFRDCLGKVGQAGMHGFGVADEVVYGNGAKPAGGVRENAIKSNLFTKTHWNSFGQRGPAGGIGSMEQKLSKALRGAIIAGNRIGVSFPKVMERVIDIEQGAGIMELRQRQILALLASQGSVRVADLSERLRVSEVTIRTDLERLARQGLLARYRGGAVARADTSRSTAFSERAGHRQAQKARIAVRAVEMIKPGDSIILDAGTTVMEVAKRLHGISPLTVVTNALNTASYLAGQPGVHVIMIGGSVTAETVGTVGPISERDIEGFLVDKLFLGGHALDIELGILDVSVEVARVKIAMIQAAKQVILLADSSKVGTRAMAKVAALNAAHVLITDSELSDAKAEAVGALGLRVIRV